MRLSASQRRDSILAAASSLFAQRGFHGTSIDEIARRVGVSPAVLYRHFPSKQTLYDAVLSEHAGQPVSYEEAFTQGGNRFESILTHMTRIYINRVVDNPDLLRIEMLSLLEGNPASGQLFDNRWKSFTDLIEDNLQQRLPADRPKRDTTILGASLMYQGMLRELLMQKLLQQEHRLEKIEIEALSDELVLLFLHAIGISKPQLSRKAVIKT